MTAVATPPIPTTEPHRPEFEDSLASALVAFQLDLPKINKSNTATVKSDKGSYSYKYADLAEVSALILPALARHGLYFISCPTITDGGQFVLRYTLSHISGDQETGSYPLPPPSTAPQALGSAITYARRYCLCAVTGVAPDTDDDDAAAAQQDNARADRNGNGSRQSRDELLSTVATTSTELQQAMDLGEYEYLEWLVKVNQDAFGVDITKTRSEDGPAEAVDFAKLSTNQLHLAWVKLRKRLNQEKLAREGGA